MKKSIISMFFSKQQKRLEEMEQKNREDQIKLIQVSNEVIEFYQLQIRRSKELFKISEN